MAQLVVKKAYIIDEPFKPFAHRILIFSIDEAALDAGSWKYVVDFGPDDNAVLSSQSAALISKKHGAKKVRYGKSWKLQTDMAEATLVHHANRIMQAHHYNPLFNNCYQVTSRIIKMVKKFNGG